MKKKLFFILIPLMLVLIGTSAASHEVTAQTVKFLSAKTEGGAEGGMEEEGETPPSEEIPF